MVQQPFSFYRSNEAEWLEPSRFVCRGWLLYSTVHAIVLQRLRVVVQARDSSRCRVGCLTDLKVNHTLVKDRLAFESYEQNLPVCFT